MLKYILVGAGIVLFGVGLTWFGLGAVAARMRATDALRARGLWTLLRAWLQPIGCTFVGVGFVLLGAAALWISFVTLTIAVHHAPPMVWVITAVALVIWDVAPVLGACGLVLWLAGGMASAVWDDATPAVMEHEAVHHMLSHVRRHRRLEENRQTPREDAYDPFRWPGLGRFAAFMFRALFLGAILLGIIENLPDLVTGHVTADDLVTLALYALGIAVVGATVFTSVPAIIGVLDRRGQAKRERLRQGSERHHPEGPTGSAVSVAEAVTRTTASVGLTGGWSPPRSPCAAPAHADSVPSYLADLGFVARQSGAVTYILPPLCAVLAGTLQMGSDKKRRDPQADYDERPQHPVALGAFQIGRYPVTVAEYACFVAAGHREPGGNWEGQLQRLDHPVDLVSWRDATAYAAWLAQLTGQSWRLPTEAEWEWAARGAEGRIYPWGDQWDPARANTSEGGMRDITPVGAYAGRGDASPWGAHDMAGNVWEWTSSAYERYPNDDRQGSQRADSNERRVLRGGAWDENARTTRAAFRLYDQPDFADISFGFRLACAFPDPDA